MKRANIKKTILSFSLLAAINATSIVLAAPDNILQKIDLKEAADGKIELILHTDKEPFSEPKLLKNDQNIYFIALDGVDFKGPKDINIDKFKNDIETATVEYIPYRNNPQNGYTKITLKTKNDKKLQLSTEYTTRTKNKRMPKPLKLLIVLGSSILLAGTYLLLHLKRKSANKYKMSDLLRASKENNGIKPEVIDYINDSVDFSNYSAKNDSKDTETIENDKETNEIGENIMYPSPDDIINDVLKNDDAVTEISNTVKERIEENESYTSIEEDSQIDEIFDTLDEDQEKELTDTIEEITQGESDLEIFFNEDEDENEPDILTTAENQHIEIKLTDLNDILKPKDSIEDNTNNTTELEIDNTEDIINNEEIIENIENKNQYEEIEPVELFESLEEEKGKEASENITDDITIDTSNIENVINSQENTEIQDNIELSEDIENKEILDNTINSTIELSNVNQNEETNPEESIEAAESTENIVDTADEEKDNVDFKSVQYQPASGMSVFNSQTLVFSLGSNNSSKEEKLPEEAIILEQEEIIDKPQVEDISLEEQEEEIIEEPLVKDISLKEQEEIIEGPLVEDISLEEQEEIIEEPLVEDISLEQEEEPFSEFNIGGFDGILGEAPETTIEPNEINNNNNNDDTDEIEILNNINIPEEDETENMISTEAIQTETVSKLEEEPQIKTESFFIENDTSDEDVSTDNFFKDEYNQSFAVNTSQTEDDDTIFFDDEDDTAELDDSEPVVVSQKEIELNKVLYLIRHEGKYSLIGTIENEVFVLNKFFEKPQKIRINSKLNESKENERIYIIKIDTWRALISITPNKMEHLLTLS